MIFFVYASQSDGSIAQNLGLADYSYFFVMKLFRPTLERFGRVVLVNNAAEVDDAFGLAQKSGRPAVFLAFAPPHKCPLPKQCPVVPVFAWEYSSIPDEPWSEDWRNSWAAVLSKVKGAITHSEYTVDTVRKSLGSEYPVVSLPAPLWDSYAKLYRKRKTVYPRKWRLIVENGVVLDSCLHGVDKDFMTQTPSLALAKHNVMLSGVVYTAVFNPCDGRKNWDDIISAFCFAFRDNPNVTLVMKLIHHDPDLGAAPVWHQMKRLSPYRCRVVAIQGYLDEIAYRRLVANSTFIVNSAHGEGQCLPLMEFMSAGRPAIAPAHTAMGDYISIDNAFIVRSSKEWTHWCHDPRIVMRTFRYRIDWESLRDKLLESYEVASRQPEKYLEMSESATQSLRSHCSRAVIDQGFLDFLQQLGYTGRSGLLSFILRALNKITYIKNAVEARR